MEEKEDERLAAMPVVDDVQEELIQLSEFLFKHHEKHARLIRIVMSRAMIEPDLAKAMGKASAEEDVPNVMERLRLLQKKGIVRQDADLEQMSHMILGTNFTLGFMTTELFGFDRKMAAEAAKLFSKIVGEWLTKK